jgi:hypothetical protein
VGARPGGRRPAAARIIANGVRTASHWTLPVFPKVLRGAFPQVPRRKSPASGMKFAARRAAPAVRMRGKCTTNAANIWLY